MARFSTVFALFAVLVLAGGSAPAFDQDAAEKVFQQECATCHHVDRALRKKKDRPGWEKTVDRMKGYAGGLITDDEAKTIIEYLTRVRGPKT